MAIEIKKRPKEKTINYWKNWLNRGVILHKVLEDIADKIQEVQTVHITPSYKETTGTTRFKTDKVADTVIKVMELKEEARLVIAHMAEARKEICEAISKISDENIRNILIEHHMQGLSFGEISVTRNISKEAIYKKYKKGITEIIKQNEKKVDS